MKFFRNLAGVLLTSAASFPIALLSSILLARFLSTDERGLYSIALNFVALATMLVQCGWPGASIYRLRRAETDPAEVLGGSLIFLGAVGLAAVGAGLLLQPYVLGPVLAGLSPAVFVLALATLPLRMLANGLGAIARGIDRFRIDNWYAFLLSASNLVAAGIALIVLDSGLLGLMVSMLLVFATLGAGLLVAVARETGLRLRLRWSEFSESFAFGLRVHALSVAGRVHERADVFLLAALLADPSLVAFYAVGKGVAQMLAQLPNAVAKTAYPQIAGLPAQEAAAFTAQMVRQNLMVLVPAACVLAAVAPLLLPALYGEAYAASSGPLLFLLGATLLQSVGIVVSRFFNGTNDQRPNILTRLVAVSVNLLLNSLWIPTHGIIGAAAALLVSYSLDAGLIVGVFLVRTRMGLGEFILPRRSDFDPYRRLVARLRRADASMT